MSYQDFNHSAALVAELYKNQLVLVPEKTTAPQPKTQSTSDKQWFLGDNHKKIAILVHDDHHVFLAEGELEFLTKMLGACKLNLADVAIINMNNTPVSIEEIRNQLYSKHVLFFGINPEELLPFGFPEYKAFTHDNCTYVWSKSLNLLNGNDDLAKQEKIKLWACLKAVFNV